MKADPRGVVTHLRRADREGNKALADFLTDEVVGALERLDAMDEAGAYIARVAPTSAPAAPPARGTHAEPSKSSGVLDLQRTEEATCPSSSSAGPRRDESGSSIRRDAEAKSSSPAGPATTPPSAQHPRTSEPSAAESSRSPATPSESAGSNNSGSAAGGAPPAVGREAPDLRETMREIVAKAVFDRAQRERNARGMWENVPTDSRPPWYTSAEVVRADMAIVELLATRSPVGEQTEPIGWVVVRQSDGSVFTSPIGGWFATRDLAEEAAAQRTGKTGIRHTVEPVGDRPSPTDIETNPDAPVGAERTEQAYVDSLHRQLETKRAQMAHDRLKIDGLEKRAETLKGALGGLYRALRERHYGRMPDEVQAAYDSAAEVLAALASTEPAEQTGGET